MSEFHVLIALHGGFGYFRTPRIQVAETLDFREDALVVADLLASTMATFSDDGTVFFLENSADGPLFVVFDGGISACTVYVASELPSSTYGN